MNVLTTARLSLAHSTPADLEDMLRLLGDPRVMEFYPEPLDRDGTAAWLLRNRERYEHHGYGIWTARLLGSGQFAGLIGLNPMRLSEREETALAYLLVPELWGHGLATEGAAACRDYALERLGLARIVSPVRPVNSRSVRVLERAGFVPHGRCLLAGFEHVVYVAGEKGELFKLQP
ncbi:GNAT family N-acetyltransferase [bacterium]|nr:GNAT family N-acetyltransferase [bacterium]